MTVSASVGDGPGESLTINRDKGRLSDEDIQRMVDEAEQFKEQDEALRKVVDAKNTLENTLYSAKNSLDDDTGKNLNDSIKTSIRDRIDQDIAWRNTYPIPHRSMNTRSAPSLLMNSYKLKSLVPCLHPTQILHPNRNLHRILVPKSRKSINLLYG